MSSVPDVSVSLVNTNSRELLLACLESLQGTDVEIVVLDNASEDGSAAAVRERFPAVSVIEQRHRRGFRREPQLRDPRHDRPLRLRAQRGHDERGLGFRRGWSSTSMRTGASRRSGRGSSIPTDAAQSSAWRFPTPAISALGLLTLGRAGILQSGGAETRDVDWAMAAALLLRREALDEVGLFDEEFFIYSEETDLARACGVRAGGRSTSRR